MRTALILALSGLGFLVSQAAYASDEDPVGYRVTADLMVLEKGHPLAHKKVWDYIKKNNLQDKAKRAMVNPS